MSSPMTPVIEGRLYWAGRRFTHRGLWIWNGKRNLRIVPINRLRQWTGPKEQR